MYCSLMPRNYIAQFLRTLGHQVIQFFRYGITNILSSYFMTVDMHRFALMWLVYSRNKF